MSEPRKKTLISKLSRLELGECITITKCYENIDSIKEIKRLKIALQRNISSNFCQLKRRHNNMLGYVSHTFDTIQHDVVYIHVTIRRTK